MPKTNENKFDLNRALTSETLTRNFTISQRSINEDDRTVEVSFSSEIEGERWGYIEILDHSQDSVRLGRLQDKGAVLMDHNHRDRVGAVTAAHISSDRRGRATVTLSRRQRAEDLLQDLVDELAGQVSVGYRVHKYEVEERKGEPDIVRITDWEPYEISFVSVPFDPSVGLGRSAESNEQLNKDETMPKPEVSTPEGEQRSVAPPVINAEQIRAEERARLSAIDSASSQSTVDLTELKREAIDKGYSAEKFRSMAYEKISEEQVKAPAVRAADDMLEKETGQEYSLVRAIAAQTSGDWNDAGFEREMSQELARSHSIIGGGLMVPAHVFAQRSTDTTTGAGLIATNHRPDLFIDTLRANTVMGRAGANFIPGLNGKFSVPKKTANAAFEWLGEGAGAVDSDVTAGKVEMGGKHVAGHVPITFEMLRQSSPAIEDIVRQDLIQGMALAIDKAALQGDGTGNNPLGILATPGINTITAGDATGKVPTWMEILKMEGQLDDADALMGQLAYLFRPTINSALKGTPKDAGSGQFVINGRECNGYDALSTTQLPAMGSLFGNFADLFIGLWGVVELIPDRDSKTGGLNVGCHQIADMAVRHAASFTKVV